MKPDSQTTKEDEEVARILAMSDEEILAQMTPEDHIEVEKIQRRTNQLLRCFDAGRKAAAKEFVEALQACIDTLDAIKGSECSNVTHAMMPNFEDISEARKLLEKYSEAS